MKTDLLGLAELRNHSRFSTLDATGRWDDFLTRDGRTVHFCQGY